jgi:hypothetical protein
MTKREISQIQTAILTIPIGDTFRSSDINHITDIDTRRIGHTLNWQKNVELVGFSTKNRARLYKRIS